MIEHEKTYLIQTLPADLDQFDHVEMVDIYYPPEAPHCYLRLRKQGDQYTLTKKLLLNEEDASSNEDSIVLTKEEYEALATAQGKRVEKTRYRYVYHKHTCEIDVFHAPLNGLVLVDFEFDSVEEKDAFRIPDFCLADVTQEAFIAGGVLAGKTYEDIKEELDTWKYQRILFL